MKKALTAEIYLKCPIIFRGHSKGPKQTLMYFGFECDDGWFDLISELSYQIERIARKLRETGVAPNRTPMVSQVKEKYGTLKYYVNNSTSEIQESVEIAGIKSSKTDEECGHLGSLKRLNECWYKTLCEQCESARL